MSRSVPEYVARRLLQAIPTLLGLSLLIFFITRVMPGDPVTRAVQGLEGAATDTAVQRLREDLRLDEPIYEQYVSWLIDFVQLDWGVSLQTRNNVFSDVLATLPATVELILISLVFSVVLGIPLGIISGINKDKLPDHLSRLFALFGMSLPRWWIAILFQVVFVGVLELFPLSGRLSSGMERPPAYTGMYIVDSLVALEFAVFWDALLHITLPAIALSVTTLAQVMRLIRSEMIEQHTKDYTMNARASGLPKNLIYYKYMLKNSLSSSITIIGLAVGGLLAAAFLVEYVFAWPGFARYGTNALLQQDVNAIVGVTMVIGVVYILVNLLVDIVYGYLDPRIRIQEGN